MLTALEANMAIHLSGLQSLELVHLQRVQLLTRVERLLDKRHLALR